MHNTLQIKTEQLFRDKLSRSPERDLMISDREMILVAGTFKFENRQRLILGLIDKKTGKPSAAYLTSIAGNTSICDKNYVKLDLIDDSRLNKLSANVRAIIDFCPTTFGFYVDPILRGQNLGQVIFASALDTLNRLGVTELILTSPKTAEFYKRYARIIRIQNGLLVLSTELTPAQLKLLNEVTK